MSVTLNIEQPTITLDVLSQGVTLEIPTTPTMTLTLNAAQGPSGSNVSTYAVRVDQTDANTVYRGEANAGSAEGVASWRIQKLVISGDDITITWASGNTSFDKIWTNRLSYTYS